MSAEQGREPTEEEIRAALEEEMRRITVDQVLLQSTVSLINLAGRRLGLAPGAEGEKDLAQVRTAIDAVRALLPLLEGKVGGEDLASLRNAVSQLQMAYAQEAGAGGATAGGQPGAGGAATGGQTGAGGAAAGAGSDEGPAEGGEPRPEQPAEPAQPGSEGPGPAQRSGRLWVPGQ